MKIGIASTDWARTMRDDPLGPVPWGGAGWVRMGQYVENSRHEVTAGGLLWLKDRFGVVTYDGGHHVDFDVLIMQRNMFADMPDKMRRARAEGQIIVNDIDDWYWGLDTSNNAFLGSHPKINADENTQHYMKVLGASSIVTTSTPYLADRISRFVSDCPIEIIENHVDVQRFTPRVHRDDVPLVGWTGSTGHRSRDLEILRGIFPGMLDREEIRLHHSGASETHPSFASRVGVEEHLVSTFPLVIPEEYPLTMCFDVGLAPLNDIPFNHAKSWIKGIEYAAAGIPFVASDLSEYRRLSEVYGIWRLAKRPRHWIQHIQALRDPEVRAEEAASNRQAVMALDLPNGQKIWDDFHESLVK